MLPISQSQERWRSLVNVFALDGENLATDKKGAGQSPTSAGEKPSLAIKSKKNGEMVQKKARTQAEGTLEGEQTHEYLKEHWQMPSHVSMLKQRAERNAPLLLLKHQ